MSEDQANDEAGGMFWNTPELIEKLLPYLDPSSTKCLAEAHDLTQETLLRDLDWSKLVRRAFPFSNNTRWGEEGELEVVTRKARALAEILKMAANPKSLQLELLHVICERFSPDETYFSAQLVRVRCPCNQTHEVAPLGFILLEEVESVLGSTEQIMVFVQARLYEEALLIALGNRARRQQGREFYADTSLIRCKNMKSAEAFFSLKEHCELVSFQCVSIEGEIGREGWAVLRQAFELPNRRDPQWAGMFKVEATSKAMTGGRREDLKAIWDAFQDGRTWTAIHMDSCRMFHSAEAEQRNFDTFFIEGGEEEWLRLAHVLDNLDLQSGLRNLTIDNHEERVANKQDNAEEGGSQDEP